MKSKKQVLADNPSYKTLINAVYNRIGKDYIQDVNSHGMEAGFPGFTYYSDTHSFAMRYRSIIVRLLQDTADQLGEEVVNLVSGFGVFRHSPMDIEDKKDLYKYLGGGRTTLGTITNVMAWFAAEEVCRMFVD